MRIWRLQAIMVGKDWSWGKALVLFFPFFSHSTLLLAQCNWDKVAGKEILLLVSIILYLYSLNISAMDEISVRFMARISTWIVFPYLVVFHLYHCHNGQWIGCLKTKQQRRIYVILTIFSDSYVQMFTGICCTKEIHWLMIKSHIFVFCIW